MGKKTWRRRKKMVCACQLDILAWVLFWHFLSEIYDQVTNYCQKTSYFSNPPKKICNNFFGGAEDFILVQLILFMQKIIKKLLSGHFLGHPPKLHYSAPQCSAMYCSVNA